MVMVNSYNKTTFNSKFNNKKHINKFNKIT